MADIIIYGRDNCSFCKRAIELAKQLHGHGFGDYEYIDILSAGIDKEKLGDLVGKSVETIPQVFVNGEPIGGYTEFAAFVSTL
ncbi:GrxA family glutaredoxin [Salmonella enterica]|nr:GrxA family glutaredoxin [Salmonella enterica]EJI3102524.1 GrxA family glutaredoxin [Salmonella enterica]EJI4256237.1 GrxA family glutaredoxin [Salmonella enterica]